MVFTRRMAKLQASSHGASNASNNSPIPTHTAVGNTAAEVNNAVYEDAAREAVGFVAPTHGTRNESNGTLKANISREDESISAGPHPCVCSNTDVTEDNQNYQCHLERRGEAQPWTEPQSTTQYNDLFLEVAHPQTESLGERFSSPLSTASSSQSDTNRRSRRRKAARSRWTRVKGQKSKSKKQISNEEAIEATETVEHNAERMAPTRQRSTKRLPRRAAKASEIDEALHGAETAVRVNKGKARARDLRTSKAAQTGSKRTRNERDFDVEDVTHGSDVPGPSRTTRRVRQRVGASPYAKSPTLLNVANARQLRHRRTILPAQAPMIRGIKRRASDFELNEDVDITKRCKTEPTSSPPSASGLAAVKIERSPSMELSALSGTEVKREEALEQCLPPSPPPSRRSLEHRNPNRYSSTIIPTNTETRSPSPTPSASYSSSDADEEDATFGPRSYSSSYLERNVPTHNAFSNVADIDDANGYRGYTAPVHDDTFPKTLERQLDQIAIPHIPPSQEAEQEDIAPLDPQLSRLVAAITHPKALLHGGFFSWYPHLQISDYPPPPSSPPSIPRTVLHRPRTPFRRVASPDLSFHLRHRTLEPPPEEYFTMLRERHSRGSTSDSSGPPTPSSDRFVLGSRSPTGSLPPSRERSLAPEPSDGLIEALRAGRVSVCPSPSPTERDLEE